MSLSAILYLVSMGTLFIGQRMLDGNDGPQLIVTIVGALLLAVSAGLRLRALRAAQDPGLRLGHRLALIGLVTGVASLVLYMATTGTVIDTLTLGDEAEERWRGTWRSLWPLVWLIGTVPMLAADYACESSPTMMPKRRARELALHGLIVAMGIGVAFPVNYIASQEKERWDLAYFKTPQPGTATLALAQALESPVDVRIFMPPSSEVAQELRNYFGPLEGPMLRVQVIDQAAEPRLAKALAVRNNGTVTFTQGDLAFGAPPPSEGEDPPPKPVTRNVKVNAEFDKAKRALKRIDADVQKVLIELGHGERIAYVTTGHGELTWRRAAQAVPELQAGGLREELKSQGFTVKELGLREKLGEGVPPDASLVMVLGPRYPFSQAETDSLRGYLESGGSLFLALEPRAARAPLPAPVEDPLDAMVAEVLGVTIGEGILADEVVHARSAGDKRDNFLLLTDSFSSHGSSVTMAAERHVFGAPFAGFLELEDGH
ncbi:MAG: GldG family protein, partial [Nannocystaceae bacterium]|nr:GldG family protein [Nannocystaceae bacterium]